MLIVRRTALRFLAGLTVIGAAMVATGGPAAAHSHSRFVFGFNLGPPCCYWGPPRYYAPAYYYPPPVAYVPPPPVYYAPPPPPAGPVCRDYHGDATIDGQGTPFYGRACLEADGRWHIVSNY
jgi:hypothetical protein